MRVVLDTNIFISGIFWSGDSERILFYWADGKFELISSTEIIEEIIKTLMNFRVPLPPRGILLWLNILLWGARVIEPNERVNIVRDDPDDNKFIESAVAGKADFIVSQDKHLLRIGEFRGIKVLEPRDFLELLG